MYGAPNKQALIESTRAELESDEELNGFLDSVIAFMAGEADFEYQSQDHRFDGTPMVTSCRLVIPPQFRHDWSRVICNIEDITERMRAEEALRESEARFRAILDNAPLEISLRDMDGRYLLVNPAWSRFHDLTDEAVRGRRLSEFCSGDLRRTGSGGYQIR